jgi:hypothetical protein
VRSCIAPVNDGAFASFLAVLDQVSDEGRPASNGQVLCDQIA